MAAVFVGSSGYLCIILAVSCSMMDYRMICCRLACIKAGRSSGAVLALLLWLSVWRAGRAQVTGVVFDMETLRPVSGVKIYMNPAGRTDTDIYGRFNIGAEVNSVTFTHGSFESLSMNVEEIRDTVWLIPKMRRLDEVVIYGVKPKLGFDMKDAVRRNIGGAGRGPSGMDIFSIFNFKANKQARRRKEIKKMLDKY